MHDPEAAPPVIASSPTAVNRPMSSLPRSLGSWRASSGPSPGACRRRRAERNKPVIASQGGTSEPPNMLPPGRAGGAVAVRRTLASTNCRVADPTQDPRLRAPQRINGHAVSTRASKSANMDAILLTVCGRSCPQETDTHEVSQKTLCGAVHVDFRGEVVLCQEGARAPCCTRDEGRPFGAVL
jgi:hypothetical protein